MSYGLFHQDTFNALLHGIFLCLQNNTNEKKVRFASAVKHENYDYLRFFFTLLCPEHKGAENLSNVYYIMTQTPNVFVMFISITADAPSASRIPR